MTATAIIDHGELSSVVAGELRQGHCTFKAHIALRKSAAWEAVTKVAGPAAQKPHRFDQQALAEWLVDQSHVIMGAFTGTVDGSESPTLPTKTAISRILSVKVKAEGERTDTVSPLAREAAARESLRIESEDAAFPTGFALYLPPYIGLQSRTIYLRLNIYVQKSESPAFSLAIVGYDHLVEQLGIEFDEALRAAIKPGRADILIGNYTA
jgi:uncharacterized protein YfdQ (DUF2303 family)